MNNQKILVKLCNVPFKIPPTDVCREIARLMDYDFIEAKDLAGLYIDVEDVPKKSLNFYVYFTKMRSIEKFRDICLDEDNGKILYIFNSKINVKFPGLITWNLAALRSNANVNDKELKVKCHRRDVLINVLQNLSQRLLYPNNDYPIKSVIHAKEAIYLRFVSSEFALRAKRELEANQWDVRFATTYSTLCEEHNEEETEPIQQKTNGDDMASTSREKVLNLCMSSQPLKEVRNERIIQLGSIQAKALENFRVGDKIFFSLTTNLNANNVNNNNDDDEMLVIDENVELPDE